MFHRQEQKTVVLRQTAYIRRQVRRAETDVEFAAHGQFVSLEFAGKGLDEGGFIVRARVTRSLRSVTVRMLNVRRK